MPDELDDRMREWDGVNWSAVAVDAFELELRKLEKGAIMNAQAIKDRITRTDDGRYRVAEAAGRKWAENVATADQLRTFGEIYHGEVASNADLDTEDAIGHWGLWIRRIDEDYDASGRRDEWWETYLGDVPTKTEMRGFIAGVSVVYELVEDEL